MHGKFTATDIGLVDAVSLIAGQYNKIGSYTVLAGEAIVLGFETLKAMNQAVGRVYAKLQTSAPAEIKGTWSIQIESPLNIPLKPLGTWRSEDFNTDAVNKTLQLPWPQMDTGASKDKKIVFYFMPDATATISKANCTVSFDITRFWVN